MQETLQFMSFSPTTFKGEIIQELKKLLSKIKTSNCEELEEYLSIKQVSELLGVSIGTVRNKVKEGILTVYTLGEKGERKIFKRSEVEQALIKSN